MFTKNREHIDPKYLSQINVLETWPQLIDYDVDVLNWFQGQNHLCGYDLNLTYPQEGKFPTLEFHGGIDAPHILSAQTSNMLTKREFVAQVAERHESLQARGLVKRDTDRAEARQQWKRNLNDRSNGTIDSWYGCSLLAEVIDYAVNYTYPWNQLSGSEMFNVSFAVFSSFTTLLTFI